MKTRTMMEIHIDSLAYAAGVASPQHLAVSHAPAAVRAPGRRWRKRMCRLLSALATHLHSIAMRLDTPEADAYH